MWAAARVWTQARRYAETPAPRLLFVLQVPYILLWQLYTSASVKMVLIYVTAEGPRSENFSATPTEQPEKKTSVSLCVLPLTGSEYQMCCCWGLRVREKKSRVRVYISEEKDKKKRFFFFEEDKSPVHKEVINICMTEQMTAYFHGNALVSPEMSAGDRSRLLWASVWLLTESPAPLDCRSQNTSKLEKRTRVHTGDRLCFNVNTLPLFFFFFIVLKENTLYSSANLKKLSFHQSAVCVVVRMNMPDSQKKKKINYCATAWGVLECRSVRPQGPSLQLVVQKSSLVVFLTNFLSPTPPFHFF